MHRGQQTGRESSLLNCLQWTGPAKERMLLHSRRERRITVCSNSSLQVVFPTSAFAANAKCTCDMEMKINALAHSVTIEIRPTCFSLSLSHRLTNNNEQLVIVAQKGRRRLERPHFTLNQHHLYLLDLVCKKNTYTQMKMK